MLKTVLVVCVVLCLAGCAPKPNGAGLPSGDPSTGRGVVDGSAIQPMDQAGYPDWFRQWGPDGIRRIEHFRKLAAERVSKLPQCDGVWMSELAPSRSVAPDHIVIMTDCHNGHREYLAGYELEGALDTRR